MIIMMALGSDARSTRRVKMLTQFRIALIAGAWVLFQVALLVDVIYRASHS
jgi:hypothetical protein